MLQAIQEDDPVLFFEPKALYQETCEVPDEMYTIPFGEANFVREGDDVHRGGLRPDGAQGRRRHRRPGG